MREGEDDLLSIQGSRGGCRLRNQDRDGLFRVHAFRCRALLKSIYVVGGLVGTLSSSFDNE